MGSVFLSYEEEDHNFAEALMHRLEQNGVQICDHKNILHPTDDWYSEADQAIKHAAALIVIMSPAARTSELVSCEWIFALGVGIPVLPVVAKDCTLHPRLTKLVCFDFTDQTTRP